MSSENSDLPKEYKKGFVKFLGCRIDLSKRVLIPRQETEFWVSLALKKLTRAHSVSVLDIFSGSGCIGIAVLKRFKNTFADFVDIDKKAIKQIKINLRLNEISSKRYRIFQSNLFEKFNTRPFCVYDFIFANPPYVAEKRIGEVQASVLKYEPKKALFAGKEGMDLIEKFLKQAWRFLNSSGIIFMEFDPLQKKDIEIILAKSGKYKKFEFKKDQLNKWRWVKIVK